MLARGSAGPGGLGQPPSCVQESVLAVAQAPRLSLWPLYLQQVRLASSHGGGLITASQRGQGGSGKASESLAWEVSCVTLAACSWLVQFTNPAQVQGKGK